MPKVSVIVPVFGVEKYIERCARSLFEQTLEDIEYLFIDDCSPDKSIDILKKILEKYPNRKSQVIIHRMDKNSGQAKVREWGIRNATGEYIIHCDSDDWIDTDMYRQMYYKGKNDSADIVICKYEISDGSKNWPDSSFLEPTQTSKIKLLKQLLTCKVSGSLCTKLIKRTMLLNSIIFPTDNMCEDIALSVQYILNSQIISAIDKPLYYYFFNSDSLCHNSTKDDINSKGLQMARNIMMVDRTMRLSALHDELYNDLLFMKSRTLSACRLLPHKVYTTLFFEDRYKLMYCKNIPLRLRLGHIAKYFGIYDIIKSIF